MIKRFVLATQDIPQAVPASNTFGPGEMELYNHNTKQEWNEPTSKLPEYTTQTNIYDSSIPSNLPRSPTREQLKQLIQKKYEVSSEEAEALLTKTSKYKPASIIEELKKLKDADQVPRNEYKEKYLDKYDSANWEKARDKWISDKKIIDPEDVFEDTKRQPHAKQLIQANIDEILESPEALSSAWLIVQHMDKDVPFQKWFLGKMTTKGYGPESEEFQLLTDRTLINSGEKQKFNTQQTFASKKLAQQNKFYYSDGTTSGARDISKTLHRENGPAFESLTGSKYWYVDGKPHREDGPAVEFASGWSCWCIDGELLGTLTKKQLIKYMELNNLTPVHLLTDNDEMVRTSAAKYKWKKK